MNEKIQKTLESAKKIKADLSEKIKEKNNQTKDGIIGNLIKVYHEVYFEDLSGIDKMEKLDVNSIKETEKIETKINDNTNLNNIYQDELTEAELEILKNIEKQIDEKFKIVNNININTKTSEDVEKEKVEKVPKATNQNKPTTNKSKKIVNNVLDIDKINIQELDLNFSKRVNNNKNDTNNKNKNNKNNNEIKSILDVEIGTELDEIDDIGKILGEDKKNKE